MKLKTLFILLFSILISNLAFNQSAIRDTFFTGGFSIDSLNTKSVDWVTEPGKLKLQTGENENLAKNKFAYLVYKSYKMPSDTGVRNGNRVIDGNFFSPSYIQILSLNSGPGGEGSYIVIDLQAIRSVNRVRMWQLGYYPGGPNNITPNLRPRAYTIYGGLDTLSMEKILQVPENLLGMTDDIFDKTYDIRFLKVTIDVIDQIQSTVISEVEVFGKGFLPEGFYTSSVRDAGQAVNWGSVDWNATEVQGGQISVRFRTGNTKVVDSTWSPWSDSVVTKGSLLDVFEPRRYAQYQIRLATTSLQSPVINSISFNYDKKLLATASESFISPLYSPVLESNIFYDTIKVTKGSNEYSLDTLLIYTPTPTELLGVEVNGIKIAAYKEIYKDKIIVGFPNSITSTSTIVLTLRFTPFLGVNRFNAFMISKETPGNPQRIDPKMYGKIEGWSVMTTGVPKKLIISPVIEPNPFTPNGDGINDRTQITFFLSNIGEPRTLIGNETRDLSIKIYDLNGRMVKEIFNAKSSAAAFVASNAFFWDGKGDNGKYVRPGVYILQIYIDSENGGEQVAKTITVAY